MNRFFTKMALSLTLFVFVGSQLHAQITTTFAKNVNPGQQSGVYYSLPQTMLQLDFVIEETECEEGPLSSYASMYFGSEEPIEYGGTEYKLLDVKMTSVVSPDPNATFFVTFASVRGGGKAQFDVLPNGIIRSVGIGNATDSEMGTPIVQTENRTGCCHNEAKQNGSFIGLMSAGKSNAQLAKEAADQIMEIRKEKFYLMSGDNEVASNPETFRLMYNKLDEMEKEYTSLFLGKRVTKQVVKTVYVIPNKGVATQTVAKFSETEGLTVGTGGSGSMITVQTLSLNTVAAINAPSQSAVESMSYENKVFYRIPETANVKVAVDGRTMLEERLIVNQLGVLLTAPITNSKLVFDTETGQIVSMRMQ